MPTLKKISPESIKTFTRNPNIDLQSIDVYSRSDIQHQIRTQQFQEFFTKSIQYKDNLLTKINENLQKPQDFRHLYTRLQWIF